MTERARLYPIEKPGTIRASPNHDLLASFGHRVDDRRAEMASGVKTRLDFQRIKVYLALP